MQITLFSSIMSIDKRRQDNRRLDVIFCIKSNGEERAGYLCGVFGRGKDEGCVSMPCMLFMLLSHAQKTRARLLPTTASTGFPRKHSSIRRECPLPSAPHTRVIMLLQRTYACSLGKILGLFTICP